MIIQLIIISALVFIAMLFILRVFSSRNLAEALSRVNKLRDDAMVKEAQIEEELKRARQEAGAEAEKGRQEARRFIEKAKTDAEIVRKGVEEQAKLEAKRIVEASREEAENLRKRLLSDLNGQAINSAVEIIKYTFSQKSIVSLQYQLIEELITDIEGLDKSIFCMKAGTAKVITAFPLPEDQKEKIKLALSEKMDFDIFIKEEIDLSLMTGLVINIGDFVIDGSLKNKLNKAVPYLKSSIKV